MVRQTKEYEIFVRLRQTQSRLCLLEQLSGIGYAELDVKSREIHCSRQIYNMLGYADEKLRSIKLADLFSPKDYQIFLQKLRWLYHQKSMVSFDVRLKASNNKWKYCRLRFDYCHINTKKIFAGTIQDLDDIIKTNKELVKAKNKAEKLNKEKSYFLAQASHDLRQPMQAQSLYLDMFPLNSLSEAQKNIFLKIKQSSENLKNLLNNFLDLSRLDYGAFKTDNNQFNIGILLSNLGNEFRDIAESQDIVFEYSICNCCVRSDAFLVERILRNLLSNAFKFARRKVGVYCREDHDFVEISVEDDGKGMDKEDLKHIFEAFYRGKNSSESKIEGAGLGLAIVKKITEILKIKISVRSHLNQGSTFSFFLKKNQ